jgi:hypothetical protein
MIKQLVDTARKAGVELVFEEDEASETMRRSVDFDVAT